MGRSCGEFAQTCLIAFCGKLSNMSEANLWKRMRVGVAPFCFSQRIENLVGEGVPDVVVHFRDGGLCAFVELKYRKLMPSRSGTPIFKGDNGLRPEQVAWIYGRATGGARIFILGQCDDTLWLLHGRLARELSALSRTQLDQASLWRGIARKTDWEGLLATMLK